MLRRPILLLSAAGASMGWALLGRRGRPWPLPCCACPLLCVCTCAGVRHVSLYSHTLHGFAMMLRRRTARCNTHELSWGYGSGGSLCQQVQRQQSALPTWQLCSGYLHDKTDCHNV